MHSNYCTIHPNDPDTPAEFFYGNMKVRRKRISDDKASRQVEAIFYGYLGSGILPPECKLTGDYLEHFLIREHSRDEKPAGRYVGIIFPDHNYQYLRIDGETVGINKRSMDTPERITILTDTCLFCTANAIATLDNGQKLSVVAPQTRINSPISTLSISETLCPYEIDSIVRLTSLISSLKEDNEKIDKVILAMPTVEYYFYLMDAYNDRYIRADIMMEWITRVNSHAEKIIRAILKRLAIPSQLCQPLEYAQEYIYTCLEHGTNVSFEQVTKILVDNSDVWRAVMPITKPRNWKDLNYTNYAISILMSARCDSPKAHLLIDIENPSEQRILRNASKIVKELKSGGSTDQFCSVGMYPHEKVFFPLSGQCDATFPRLYYMGDEQSPSGILFRQIVEANRQKML